MKQWLFHEKLSFSPGLSQGIAHDNLIVKIPIQALEIRGEKIQFFPSK
tara:strand:+ start:46619 stop:46762 length:144 start_codon:yes stop_codon:yes gene_type:complete